MTSSESNFHFKLETVCWGGGAEQNCKGANKKCNHAGSAIACPHDLRCFGTGKLAHNFGGVQGTCRRQKFPFWNSAGHVDACKSAIHQTKIWCVLFHHLCGFCPQQMEINRVALVPWRLAWGNQSVCTGQNKKPWGRATNTYLSGME